MTPNTVKALNNFPAFFMAGNSVWPCLCWKFLLRCIPPLGLYSLKNWRRKSSPVRNKTLLTLPGRIQKTKGQGQRQVRYSKWAKSLWNPACWWQEAEGWWQQGAKAAFPKQDLQGWKYSGLPAHVLPTLVLQGRKALPVLSQDKTKLSLARRRSAANRVQLLPSLWGIPAVALK